MCAHSAGSINRNNYSGRRRGAPDFLFDRTNLARSNLAPALQQRTRVLPVNSGNLREPSEFLVETALQRYSPDYIFEAGFILQR